MGTIRFEQIAGLMKAISQRYGTFSLPEEEARIVIAGFGETVSDPEIVQILNEILTYGTMARSSASNLA